MEQRLIKVLCQGADLIDVFQFKPIYYDLKQCKKKSFKQFQLAIMTMGYFMPTVIWADKNNQKLWIIDGHIRNTIIRMLIEKENYKLQQLDGTIDTRVPVVFLNCDTMEQAKKMHLLGDSQYGRIIHEGFNEYIHDPNCPVNFDWIKAMCDIPRYSFSFFEKTYLQDGSDINYQPEPKEEETSKPKKKYLKFVYNSDEEKLQLMNKLRLQEEKEEYSVQDLK